jgi:hypothetical protein
MPNSSGKGWLFGSRSGSGAVTVVEVSVAQSAARRSLMVFRVLALAGLAIGVLAALFNQGDPVLAIAIGLAAGVGCGLATAFVVRAWPVLRAVWHWALEIGLAAGLVVGWLALADAVSSWLSLAVLVVLLGLGALLGSVRRWLVMVAWCAIVRHRLRFCFAEFIRTPGQTKVVRAPLILVARPTPAGERVWVWLRAGLDLSDLEDRIGKVAVACWASEVQVVRASRRYAALVRLDIARRDPLTGRVDSVLPSMIPDGFAFDDSQWAGITPSGLDLPDVPEPVDKAIPRQRRA